MPYSRLCIPPAEWALCGAKVGILGFGHQKTCVCPPRNEKYQTRPILLRNFFPAFMLTVFSANIVARTVWIPAFR